METQRHARNSVVSFTVMTGPAKGIANGYTLRKRVRRAWQILRNRQPVAEVFLDIDREAGAVFHRIRLTGDVVLSFPAWVDMQSERVEWDGDAPEFVEKDPAGEFWVAPMPTHEDLD